MVYYYGIYGKVYGITLVKIIVMFSYIKQIEHRVHHSESFVRCYYDINLFSTYVKQ